MYLRIIAISVLRIGLVAIVAMVAVLMNRSLWWIIPLQVGTKPWLPVAYCFAALTLLSIGAVRNVWRRKLPIYITPFALELAVIWIVSWYGLQGHPSVITDLVWGKGFFGGGSLLRPFPTSMIGYGSAVGATLFLAVGVFMMWLTRRRPSHLCPKCRYELRGLTQPKCPECGAVIDTKNIPTVESTA